MNVYQEAIDKYLENNGFEAFCPKAVLFDMDGVIYDSMPHHAIAWQQSMAHFGIEMSEMDAYLTEGMRGIDTIRKMVSNQLHRNIDENEAQLMYDEKTKIFHSMPETIIMPGIQELMTKIKACGMRIGVVTGSGQRPLIKRIVSDFKTFIDEEHIVTAYDIKKGKPAPDPYLMGLKKMDNILPYEAIVVENAPLGVKAGVAANIFTIAVNTGPLPDYQLTCQGANVIFSKMTDLNQEWDTFYQAIVTR